MLTYQVKLRVQSSIESEWITWMKTHHVPDVISTGLVRSFHILKPSSEEHLYLFHYHFESTADYDTYQRDHAPNLKAHPAKEFPNQFSAERETFHWI